MRFNGRSSLFALGFALVMPAVLLAGECANYVTTSINDEPDMGTLLGSQTVTEEIAVQPNGVGARGTITYEVGYYRMSSGETIQIDCRDYTPV